MDRGMTTIEACFADAAAGAPVALAERARAYLIGATGSTDSTRLARASRRALDASIADGSRRECALDLLAADALLTMALLVVAREHPGSLLDTAIALRRGATATG